MLYVWKDHEVIAEHPDGCTVEPRGLQYLIWGPPNPPAERELVKTYEPGDCHGITGHVSYLGPPDARGERHQVSICVYIEPRDDCQRCHPT